MGENTIWVEKYRPRDFSNFKGQENIIKRIKAFVKQENMPHLMFAGPSGVGKTTLALIIARKLYGDSWRENFLELNASDRRGIDTIRTEVKDFARTKAMSNVPFKILYLDESDALTREAQQALRRTMENYTNTTRFILSCVTPETKILLPEEIEMKIEDFLHQYEKNQQHVNLSNISSTLDYIKEDLVLATVEMPPKLINKKVFEIITMTGRKIKATADHKLRTINGWKEAGKITKDDKLLIHPHLEGTFYQDYDTKLINKSKFAKYLSKHEEKMGFKDISKAKIYRKLMTKEKQKIIERIKKLKEIINGGRGLTERELELHNLIKKNGKIARESLQVKMGITRMGINYLLSSIEKKGYITRTINKKIHSFNVTPLKPIKLRNDMDIKKIIEKEFKIKISYSAVKRSEDKNLNRGTLDMVLNDLKRKGLLEITYNNVQKVGALVRICGFMLGDGHIGRNNIRLHFSGNREALNEVKKDLDILGYSNYSEIKSVTLKNTIKKREFKGTSTSFTVDARALSLLLQYLGVPSGDKTITSYNVPDFVKNGTKFTKREFLRSFFGCEADKPNYNKKNFGAVTLRQNKSKYLKNDAILFCEEISRLLKEFGIDSYIKIRDLKEVRTKDNIPVLTFCIIITPNNKNLLRFFSRINYYYEGYKINLARQSAEYLRHKLHLINTYKQKAKLAITYLNNGTTQTETAKDLEVTLDFVANRIKGKKVGLPRNQFMNFDKWVKKYKFNDTLIINDIFEINEVIEEKVMDVTCHKDHNFITNGFISHNCNFSSKIIDAIQSRCTVFRFKPLEIKELKSILENISKLEKIKINDKAINAIHELSKGDARRAENILQSSATISNNITEDLIYEVVSLARPKEINEILNIAIKGDFLKARNKLLRLMLKQGLSGLDVIKQVQQEVWNLDIEDKDKVNLIDKCGEIEFRMVEGSDEFVQVEALLVNFTKLN